MCRNLFCSCKYFLANFFVLANNFKYFERIYSLGFSLLLLSTLFKAIFGAVGTWNIQSFVWFVFVTVLSLIPEANNHIWFNWESIRKQTVVVTSFLTLTGHRAPFIAENGLSLYHLL